MAKRDMAKVVQLVAYQTNLVDEDDHIDEDDNPNAVVLALTEDGRIFITQNPQLDICSFDASCWRELEPPSQKQSVTLEK